MIRSGHSVPFLSAVHAAISSTSVCYVPRAGLGVGSVVGTRLGPSSQGLLPVPSGAPLLESSWFQYITCLLINLTVM